MIYIVINEEVIDINNSNLRTLLNEYSIKRNKKINEAQVKKNDLYKKLKVLAPVVGKKI